MSGVVSIEGLHDTHGVLALERDSYSKAEGVQFVNCDHASAVLVVLAEDVINSGLQVHGRRDLLEDSCLEAVEAILDNVFVLSGQVLILKDHVGAGEHLYELIIVRDAHGKLFVVVSPLLGGDVAVIVSLGSIEVVQELNKNLFFGLLSCNDIRVLGCTLKSAQVSGIDVSASVSVHDVEAASDHVSSAFIQLLA